MSKLGVRVDTQTWECDFSQVPAFCRRHRVSVSVEGLEKTRDTQLLLGSRPFELLVLKDKPQGNAVGIP